MSWWLILLLSVVAGVILTPVVLWCLVTIGVARIALEEEERGDE